MRRGFIDAEVAAVFAAFVVGCLIGGIAGHGIGWCQATDREREKAVENGAGHWDIVGDGPKTEFVYGPKPKN